MWGGGDLAQNRSEVSYYTDLRVGSGITRRKGRNVLGKGFGCRRNPWLETIALKRSGAQKHVLSGGGGGGGSSRISF